MNDFSKTFSETEDKVNRESGCLVFRLLFFVFRPELLEFFAKLSIQLDTLHRKSFHTETSHFE